MKLREKRVAETRKAILDAVAVEITESGLTGFSIQGVADRAGVTHRTVYNYFPTREALNDAFAEHIEATLAARGIGGAEQGVGVAGWPKLAAQMFGAVGANAADLQAYVMMTIATGKAARVFRARSKAMEKLVDEELGPLEPGVAKLVTSAVRMFMSSAGWFLLSKHHGLSAADAGRVSEWAMTVLLDAARRGDVPQRSDKQRLDKGKKKDA